MNKGEVLDMAECFVDILHSGRYILPAIQRPYIAPSWLARNIYSGWFKEPEDVIINTIEEAELFQLYTGATILYSCNGYSYPHYDIEGDFICVPPPRRWRGTEFVSPTLAYYSTINRELIHWTGGTRRLNRTVDRLDPVQQPLEEIAAILGQCVLDRRLLKQEEPHPNALAHMKNWIEATRWNTGAIFNAVPVAIAAISYLDTITGIAKAWQLSSNG